MSKKKKSTTLNPHCGYDPVWHEEYDEKSFYKRIWLECPICGLHTNRYGDKFKKTIINDWNSGRVYENKDQ